MMVFIVLVALSNKETPLAHRKVLAGASGACQRLIRGMCRWRPGTRTTHSPPPGTSPANPGVWKEIGNSWCAIKLARVTKFKTNSHLKVIWSNCALGKIGFCLELFLAKNNISIAPLFTSYLTGPSASSHHTTKGLAATAS